VSICSGWFCTGFFAELCVCPYLSGRLPWATERHNLFFSFPLFIYLFLYSLLTIPQHRIFLGSCSGIDLPIKTRDKFLNYSPKSYHPLEHQLQTVGFLVSNEAKTPSRYLSGSLLSQKRRGKQKITKNKENLAYVYWLYRLLCCILGLYTNSKKLVRAIVFYIWY
jgi:hypothetical protein